MDKPVSLVLPDPFADFRRHVAEACVLISASRHTRRAYFTDAERFLAFAASLGVDPTEIEPIHVAAWVESMKKEGLAPKTRNRRLAACSSIFQHLRRTGRVSRNPFSADEGPKREPAPTKRPTPIAEVKGVAAALKACERDRSPQGLRDAALIRMLWATGARRSSLVEVTRARLVKEDDSYAATVPAKGGKTVRLWFTGKAAEALSRWLSHLDSIGVRKGAVFRLPTGTAMIERDVWRAVRRRGEQGGGYYLTPHSFRVAFLTLNPASLEERQDAVGHASPETTRLYERSWRGQRAFVLMPEVEDLVSR